MIYDYEIAYVGKYKEKNWGMRQAYGNRNNALRMVPIKGEKTIVIMTHGSETGYLVHSELIYKFIEWAEMVGYQCLVSCCYSEIVEKHYPGINFIQSGKDVSYSACCNGHLLISDSYDQIMKDVDYYYYSEN